MTPFATGYTEAALAELNSRRIRASSEGLAPYTVDDLAPATVERIIGDCERYEGGGTGAVFWSSRQAGVYPTRFPPLSAFLGDDGLIYLREAA